MFNLLLFYVVLVKSKMKISQNFGLLRIYELYQITCRDVGMHGVIIFTQSEFLIAATRQVLHEYKKA